MHCVEINDLIFRKYSFSQIAQAKKNILRRYNYKNESCLKLAEYSTLEEFFCLLQIHNWNLKFLF